MVQLLNQAWRNELADMASVARRSILVAAPFIKYEEARWLCKQLRPGIEVITLTTIDADAVSALALDLTALRHLAEVSPSATLFALPNLHAKVFVIDEKAAIITSGNLTRSSLDTNIEYGVLLRKTELVRTVSALMPTLCDESKHFIIKGERYGKEWKRRLRHAQLHLKRKGVVTYNSNRKTWMLTQP